jgi:Conserved mid region of cactin
MKIVCRDRQKTSAPEGRVLSSVVTDINKILSPKTYEQLETLEVQVKRKLNSNEPIDTDYWEELLRSLTVWKAKAKLKKVFQAVIEGRVQALRKQQRDEAESVRLKLSPIAPVVGEVMENKGELNLDPEPLLQLRPEDKALEIMDESAFLAQVVCFPIFALTLTTYRLTFD